MDFNKDTIKMPEQKCIKGLYLLAREEFQPGSRTIRTKSGHELRGSAQHWSTAFPALRAKLGVMDAMLAQSDGNSTILRPKGDQQVQEEIWEEFHDTLDFCRILLTMSIESEFDSTFKDLLTVRERLALPDARIRWLGGDATKEQIGAIDWGRNESEQKAYIAVRAEELLVPLRRLTGTAAEDDADIIACVEMLTLVVLAVYRGEAWRGDLAFYVTDNDVTRAWLEKRRTKHPVGRHLIRILELAEATYNFRVVTALYIRTYHNQLSDWISRTVLAIVHDRMKKEGWLRVEVPTSWCEIVEEAKERILKLPGAKGGAVTLALQLHQRRKKLVLAKPLQPKGSLLEFGSLLAHYARAWTEAGGTAQIARLSEDIIGLDMIWPGKASAGEGHAIWCVSLSLDPSGKERKTLSQRLGQTCPQVVVIDAPTQLDISQLCKAADGLGLHRRQEVVRCAEQGDVTSRTRMVLALGKKEGIRQLPPLGRSVPVAQSLKALPLLREAEVPGDCWAEVKSYSLDPRLSTTGDRSLPWPMGTCKVNGTRTLVYDTRGPGGTARDPSNQTVGSGGLLIGSMKNGSACPRRLAGLEVWRMQGGSDADWQRLLMRYQERDVLRQAARSQGPVTAARILEWLQNLEATEDQEEKAGFCVDRDEEKAWGDIKQWLKAWGRNPEHPDQEQTQKKKYKLLEPTNLVGALPKKKGKKTKGRARAKSCPPEELVAPVALGRARQNGILQNESKSPLMRSDYIDYLDAMANEAILSKLSFGTRKGYATRWKKWLVWRKSQNKPIFCLGDQRRPP